MSRAGASRSANPEVVGARRERGVLPGQRREHGEPARRPAADGHPVGVDASVLGEGPGGGEAVGDVDEAPRPRELRTVGAPVPGRAAVVDVDHREPAARPVLHAEGEHRDRGPGRPAVQHREQGRAVALRALVGGARWVEQRVGGPRGARRVDRGERHRLRHRDRRRVEAQLAGRAQRRHHRRVTRHHPVHAELGGRAARDADDGVRAVGADRADHREPGVEHGQRPVGVPEHQRVEALRGPGEHHPAVGEHRVAGPAELPPGHTDLRLERDEALDVAAGGAAVEVPPAAAVGQEGQRPVGLPPGLGHRLPRTAGDHRVGTGAEVADGEHRVVPRHRGVVPGEPRQRAAVGGDPRGGHEVRAADQHLGLGGDPGVEPDDLVAHRGRGGVGRRVPFAYRDQPRPVRGDMAVGEAVPPRHRRVRREHDRLPAGVETA